jgi:ABC-type glycerol-3-phosphate transport system substrate-binding protein
MISGMTKFQLILTGIFAFFLLAGILIFAVARPSSGARVPVTVWGPIPQANMGALLMSLPIGKSDAVQINYTYVKETDFDTQFIEALASGKGPDVVIVSQDGLLKHKDKLIPIPFESYSERTFKDTFAEEGELFLNGTGGILAFPLTIDPLVLYWNRDIFTSAGIAAPPKFWDEFYELSKTLTQKDGALNITRPTIALGEYSNITNAKEIISALMLQAGTSIVEKGSVGYLALQNSSGENTGGVSPAVSAVNFYTEFSNAAKPHYSWNRSLQNSQTMFLAGDLAVYIGFSSELPFLKLKNPNLNFDVATLPQVRGGSRSTTFGRIQGLAVVRSTKNSAAAFTAISGLMNNDAAQAIAKDLAIAPGRRDLLSEKQSDANKSTFYQSALWSRGWLDPDRAATANAFRDMIESITGGRERANEAVNRFKNVLADLLKKIN